MHEIFATGSAHKNQPLTQIVKILFKLEKLHEILGLFF